ncbi:MAG: hypothetical protein AB7O48_09100 [Cyclobacteriaceae bacterium]
MKGKVIKTTFEEESRLKDDAFLALDPLERLALQLKVRELMKRSDAKYSYKGMRVKITKLA